VEESKVYEMFHQVQRDITTLGTSVAASVATLTTSHIDLKEQLFGDGGRVKALERQNEIDSWKDWAKLAVLVPIGAAIHTVAHWLGWIKE